MIIVIRLDHPQCPKLGRLWMQAEPSESQGRIISKDCFIKRPFIDRYKLHNKPNFIQFWDIGPETRNHQLNAKTTLLMCPDQEIVSTTQTPSPPDPDGKTLHRLWREFVHSINSSTLQMGILLLDKYLRSQYGNTSYGVSSPGIQNYKGLCQQINLPKGNYWILRIGVVTSCQTSSKSFSILYHWKIPI